MGPQTLDISLNGTSPSAWWNEERVSIWRERKKLSLNALGWFLWMHILNLKIFREVDRYHTVLRTDLGHKTHHRSTILFALDGVFRVSVKTDTHQWVLAKISTIHRSILVSTRELTLDRVSVKVQVLEHLTVVNALWFILDANKEADILWGGGIDGWMALMRRGEGRFGDFPVVAVELDRGKSRWDIFLTGPALRR